MKNKKIFIIILTILLCFTMFQKPKKIEAFDFVITPTVLWTLGSLVVGTGIVALNYDQVLDMGQMVADKVDNISDFIDGQKLRLAGSLLKAILSTASDLPTSNKTVSPIVNLGYSEFVVSDSFNVPEINVSSAEEYFNLSTYNSVTLLNDFDYSVSAYILHKGTLKSRHNIPPLSKVVIKPFYAYSTIWDQYNYGIVSHNLTENIYRMTYIALAEDYDSFSRITYPADILLSSTFNISIPYDNPLVRENYGPDVLPGNIPYDDENNIGVVSIPTFLPDVSISADNPYDWDIAKDTIDYDVIPGDSSIPDTGEIDFPDTGTIEDVPGSDIPEGLSLWGWLKALLMAILNFIKGIFDVIKSILDFIKNFIANLINALSDLGASLISTLVEAITAAIEFLFYPTLSSNDLFKPINNTGFGNIVDFFDFSDLFDISPKPFRFYKIISLDYLIDKSEHIIDIDFSEFALLNEYLPTIRNLMSYPILLINIYYVINNLLPKRVVD